MTQAQLKPRETTSTQRLVLRNALQLVAAQVLGMPLSIAVNAAMARYLGPVEFGYLYLASTIASFALIAIDWGSSGVLPAVVAKDPTRAGELLGTSMGWRVVTSVVVYGILAPACWLFGYSREFQIVLGLTMLGTLISTVLAACQSTIRGFERTDIAALGTLAQQVLGAALVLPTLFFGGKVAAVLLAQAASTAIVLVLVFRALGPVGVGRTSIRFATLRSLWQQGMAFLFFDLAMVLQPNVDAIMLSKLGPAEPIGWLAAARKLIGVLVFPASALSTALYPTLCRLYAEDRERFGAAVSGAIRTTATLTVPVALGCALYPDIGVGIFGRQSFGPVRDDLRILALFVLLVYFSMVTGTALVAAGRQRAWAITQFGCVLVSVVLDPILVPWFQSRAGNGGLGICLATVVSESIMVLSAILLAPSGIFNRSILRALLLVAAAGVGMAAVAKTVSRLPSLAGAPIAVAAYLGCLWAIGGIDREQIETFRSILSRKMRR